LCGNAHELIGLGLLARRQNSNRIQEAQLSLTNRPTLMHADVVLSSASLWWVTAISRLDFATHIQSPEGSS